MPARFVRGEQAPGFEAKHSTAADQLQPIVTRPDGTLAVQGQAAKSVL